MNKVTLSICLTLASCTLLSSCRMGMLTVDSSQRLEAALRDGEAEHASYSDLQWRLTDEAVMEATLEDGRKYYFLPVELSAKVELDSWLEYHRSTTYGLQPTWGSGKGELVQLPAKKLYMPLRLASTNEKPREFLKQYGVNATMYRKMDSAFKSPQSISHLPSDFPPACMKIRRIAIPHLEKALRGEIKLFGHYYYTKPSSGVRVAEMATHVLVDLPVAAVGFTLGSLYETLFGWMR